MSPVFDEKCEGCTEYSRCRDSFRSWIYFVIGLIATIAIRVVVIFQNVSPIYGKIAWYVGVVGFFIFFLYKFRVGHEREKHIELSGIVDKVDGREVLDEKDYENLGAILCSLRSRKERVNFFFIFATSVLAIAAALYFDFFK